jgi:MerR family transcriptional regulator, light-induced transcriptional regulator
VSTPEKPSEPVELSIGTLSIATGVPVDTLRTWERRYGFPVPTTRTGGSHRRYAADMIDQVRLIVRALELGHRPSAVVGRDPEELKRLLGAASLPGEPAAAPPSVSAPSVGASSVASTLVGAEPGADPAVLARWLELTRDMDGEGLTSEFQRSLAVMPVMHFLEQRMGPYLHEMGEQWARGLLRVSQEHYASEKAREFLNAQWRGANEGNRSGRAAVLATPPGEPHTLGLHMAAWVTALAGVHVVFLGANTPMAEVAFAVERHAAQGVVLSVAAGYDGDLRAELDDLEGRLPRPVSIALGGAGTRGVGRDDQDMNRFSALFEWATGLANGIVSDPPGTGSRR